MSDGRMRERRAAPRLSWVFALLAVDVVDALGFSVVGLEFVIGNRPCRRHSAVMADFAKIFFAQTEQSRAIKFCVAAHVVVRVWMQVFAVPIAPDFLGVVLAVLVDGLRAPVVFFARHVRSALNEQDGLAAGRQAIGQRSTARARADDDDVKVFVHDGSWSVARGKPYRSEGHTIPVAPSLCPVTMVS